jgi:hypothetical protein
MTGAGVETTRAGVETTGVDGGATGAMFAGLSGTCVDSTRTSGDAGGIGGGGIGGKGCGDTEASVVCEAATSNGKAVSAA